MNGRLFICYCKQGDAKCKNGIMLFIALGDRAFSVNVGNDARGRLTGARVEALLNKIGPHLSSKNYAKALKIFLIGVDSHMKGPIDKSGPPYALLGLLGGGRCLKLYLNRGKHTDSLQPNSLRCCCVCCNHRVDNEVGQAYGSNKAD